MIKAIIYLRVSTEEQAERGFSLQAQRVECLEKAKELNCSDILEFCDEGVSGSILERPMLLNALEAMKLHTIDYIICYDPSRLSRNVSHQLILIDNIKKFGTKLVFVRSSYEDSAEGRFQITIMAAVDEYERARLKIRTELGKRAKANQKILTHSPNIYGYIFDKDSDTLYINEEQAKVIRMMYDWLLDDKGGPAKISERLNKLCVPSMRGKEWNRVSVNRILRNYSYTGTIYIRRYDTKDYKLNKFKKKEEKIKVTERPREQWIGIKIPQIIETTIWEKAILILNKSKRANKGGEKQEFILSGLLKCGVCGGTIFGKSTSKSDKGANRYYCCSNKYNYKLSPESRCYSKLYKADELENVIWEKVKPILLNKYEIENILVNSSYNKEEKNSNAQYFNNKQLLMDALKEKEKIIMLFQKEIINEKELDKKIENINNKIKIINETITENYATNFNVDENTIIASDFIERYINNMPIAFKNKVLNKILQEIIILNNEINIKSYIPTKLIEKL
jgi:site-specific DNA recombinase